MCIIVNKMDWEKRKKMAYTTEKVQTLRCAASPSPETWKHPQPPRRSRLWTRPGARAAPAAAALCRRSAGPGITLAQESGARPGWQPSWRVSANGLCGQKKTLGKSSRVLIPIARALLPLIPPAL